MKQMAIKICIVFSMVFAAQSVLAAEPVPVFVSILPQKYIVQQIGGERVDVSVMVQPGADPHTYEPKPSQMAKLSKARIYFAIGVPFENFWLDKFAATNSKMTIVHTDAGIKKIAMATHHHDGEKERGHHEGEHHEDGHHAGDHHDGEHHDAIHNDDHAEDTHGHEGLDPHVWTSPERVVMLAENTLQALVKADPDNRQYYDRNHEAFVKELRQLDRELRDIFKNSRGMRVMVFHPAWGYLARDYGLVQVPIEVEGKNPKPAQLKELIQHAREEQINVIFVQPQFSSKSAKLVAGEIGGQVVKADPLSENWKENILTITAQFKEALK